MSLTNVGNWGTGAGRYDAALVGSNLSHFVAWRATWELHEQRFRVSIAPQRGTILPAETINVIHSVTCL